MKYKLRKYYYMWQVINPVSGLVRASVSSEKKARKLLEAYNKEEE